MLDVICQKIDSELNVKHEHKVTLTLKYTLRSLFDI